MPPKDVDRMGNSVGPDQTAPNDWLDNIKISKNLCWKPKLIMKDPSLLADVWFYGTENPYFECKAEHIGRWNKTCHRDRIARLTAPCPSHKNVNVKLFVNADANAGGSTIALPGLRPGELKMQQNGDNTPLICSCKAKFRKTKLEDLPYLLKKLTVLSSPKLSICWT